MGPKLSEVQSKFSQNSIEAQYRTGRYRGVQRGKIALACRTGITQDAQFKRFNICLSHPAPGRTVCRTVIA
jgi:hypothetical protein